MAYDQAGSSAGMNSAPQGSSTGSAAGTVSSVTSSIGDLANIILGLYDRFKKRPAEQQGPQQLQQSQMNLPTLSRM